MSAQIIPHPEATPLPEPEPDPDMVRMIEKLLEDVKAGRVEAVGFVALVNPIRAGLQLRTGWNCPKVNTFEFHTATCVLSARVMDIIRGGS